MIGKIFEQYKEALKGNDTESNIKDAFIVALLGGLVLLNNEQVPPKSIYDTDIKAAKNATYQAAYMKILDFQLNYYNQPQP